MSKGVLPFVLAGEPAKLDMRSFRFDANGARKIARFWSGRHDGAAAKASCFARIEAAWNDAERVREVLAGLRPAELAVVRLVKRFGGSISGPLLKRELIARGIVPDSGVGGVSMSYDDRRRLDPVHNLCERLVLIESPSEFVLYGIDQNYPDVSLPVHLASFVEPAAPFPWGASGRRRVGSSKPGARSARSAAQVIMDLQDLTTALALQRTWKVNQGGALSTAMRGRLAKLRPAVEGDLFDPPDRAALDYYVLSMLGVIDKCEFVDDAMVDQERADDLFRCSIEAQVHAWIRAWLSMQYWRDGVGAVSWRDSSANSMCLAAKNARQARAVLVWALTRVAHNNGNEWLNLERFLLDLRASARSDDTSPILDFCTWQPRFSAASEEQMKSGRYGKRPHWLLLDGVLYANMLLSTLVHLGVVERGRVGDDPAVGWCFRLTDVGKVVFGAPEVSCGSAPVGGKCLTVQPNYDVLFYLDAADGASIAMLTRLASRVSSEGLVQTFKITRDSVYGALEAGMTLEAIESFLRSRSRSDLPSNIVDSLAEWSRKRESITVRRELAVCFSPMGCGQRGRSVGPRVDLVARDVAGELARALGVDIESTIPRKEWQIDEQGRVVCQSPMSLVGRARLRRFACLDNGDEWRISAESLGAAKDLGYDAEQLLGWIAEHSTGAVLPVIAICIKNRLGGGERAFFGNVVLLQVSDSCASEALCSNESVRPHLMGMLAPGSFVVTEQGSDDVTKFLSDLGFALDVACKVEPLAVVSQADGVGEASESVSALEKLGAIARGNRKR